MATRNPVRKPPEMYKTLYMMKYLPYQLVSRISEPSTVPLFLVVILLFVSPHQMDNDFLEGGKCPEKNPPSPRELVTSFLFFMSF